ncbi:MAG TPA: phospholipase D family protein [Thermoguttaceae bacterium]|nr:phospholipase D family protein [Thermoguttaceae bacterium]
MKSPLRLLCLAALLSTLAAMPSLAADVAVFFSPNGGCTAEIVDRISRAETSVDVSAYSFSSPPIGNALIDAMNRGLAVRVIVDAGQESHSYSTAPVLVAAGVDVVTDSRHAIFHNKVIVIDKSITITGSFNFTKSAETRNAENIVVIRDIEVAAKYVENFQHHYRHSTPFKSKKKPQALLVPQKTCP